MKYFTFIFFLISTSIISYSQPVNCNDDPNGPVWLAGGENMVASDEDDIIATYNQMEINPNNIQIVLDDQCNNSMEIYWPGIGNQSPQSMCSQFSLVYYTYTYEHNYMINESAASNENKFHPSFTYNFLNSGVDKGSSLIYGIETLKEVGCPDLITYGYTNVPIDDFTEWMTGYGKYETALTNRVVSAEKVDIVNDLNVLKYWLFNHNNSDYDIGGLACIIIENMDGCEETTINLPGSPYDEKDYISFVDYTDENDVHAMTIVGYDDNFSYGGFNGALILANSWGLSYGGPNGEGFVYLPYELIDDPDLFRIYDGNMRWAFVIHVDPDFNPDFILRQEIMCDDRFYISHKAGGHNVVGSAIPLTNYSYMYDTYDVAGFDHNPILGSGTTGGTMEFSLDYQFFLDKVNANHNDVKTFHYGIWHNSYTNPEPTTMHYLSLVDNRCTNELEIVYGSPPYTIDMTIFNDYNNCWKGIDYVKVHEEIKTNTTITEDTYVHCQTVISDNSTLTIPSHTKLLFYDGEIIVNQGCTLELDGNCTLEALQGHSKIIVYGNLVIQNNPVISCNGGSFEINYQNNIKSYVISSGSYGEISDNRFSITGISNNLTIENCNIYNADIRYEGNLTLRNINNAVDLFVDFQGGNLVMENNPVTSQSLSNTNVFVSKPKDIQNSVIIQNNTFLTDQNVNEAIINIEDFSIVSIENNDLQYSENNGICLYHVSGASIVNNDLLSTNLIDTRGISLFFSSAEITGNIIQGNEYGIVSFGHSNPIITGDENASQASETQQFIDNITHCFFSYTSYPSEIEHNYFEKSSTLGDDPYVEVVYYDIIEDPDPPTDGSLLFDIECNQWDWVGDFRQNCIDKLVPHGDFICEPRWEMNGPCINILMTVQEMYQEATTYVDDSSYNQADSTFKELIDIFPAEYYAISSLKDLYVLEELNSNNYLNLQNYYQDVIDADEDSLLCNTAAWMRMHCDVKLENYQIAIDWLDSVITNPTYSIDSIFALINLGYIYIHYDTSNKQDDLLLCTRHG